MSVEPVSRSNLLPTADGPGRGDVTETDLMTTITVVRAIATYPLHVITLLGLYSLTQCLQRSSQYSQYYKKIYTANLYYEYFSGEG